MHTIESKQVEMSLNTKASNPHLCVQQMPVNLMPLLITSGEPAGIGMDIVLQLAVEDRLTKLTRGLWVLASAEALQQRITMLMDNNKLAAKPNYKVLAKWHPDLSCDEMVAHVENGQKNIALLAKDAIDFWLIDIPSLAKVTPGVLTAKNAAMVIKQLTLAHHLAMKRRVAAIVTAPIQKSILIEAEVRLMDHSMFTGHTEFFMQLSQCNKVVMMLANPAMRVALVTTHLPLKEVASAITKANVRQTVAIVIADLKSKFGLDNPRILVCGLNPHAGEGGHLGVEEITVIDPVLNEFRQQGVNISNAMPADTLFTKHHLNKCDAVIAMYHDQGLPVLKSHGFGDSVNVTLGLPYIRTSVDHGTALDLAATGWASASSLWQALLMADEMASQCSLK